MLGELLEMDAVTAPTYDWSAAAASAILMGCRINGRREALVPENLSDDRSNQIWNFVRPHVSVATVKMDPFTGQMDLDDLQSKICDKTAVVYFENPTYLGTIETEADVIVEMAHEGGALAIAGIDPITTGSACTAWRVWCRYRCWRLPNTWYPHVWWRWTGWLHC